MCKCEYMQYGGDLWNLCFSMRFHPWLQILPMRYYHLSVRSLHHSSAIAPTASKFPLLLKRKLLWKNCWQPCVHELGVNSYSKGMEWENIKLRHARRVSWYLCWNLHGHVQLPTLRSKLIISLWLSQICGRSFFCCKSCGKLIDKTLLPFHDSVNSIVVIF